MLCRVIIRNSQHLSFARASFRANKLFNLHYFGDTKFQFKLIPVSERKVLFEISFDRLRIDHQHLIFDSAASQALDELRLIFIASCMKNTLGLSKYTSRPFCSAQSNLLLEYNFHSKSLSDGNRSNDYVPVPRKSACLSRHFRINELVYSWRLKTIGIAPVFENKLSFLRDRMKFESSIGSGKGRVTNKLR